jgi:hypothetical protein
MHSTHTHKSGEQTRASPSPSPAKKRGWNRQGAHGYIGMVCARVGEDGCEETESRTDKETRDTEEALNVER